MITSEEVVGHSPVSERVARTVLDVALSAKVSIAVEPFLPDEWYLSVEPGRAKWLRYQVFAAKRREVEFERQQAEKAKAQAAASNSREVTPAPEDKEAGEEGGQGEAPACPWCGGRELAEIGVLAGTRHLRCRDCGHDSRQ